LIGFRFMRTHLTKDLASYSSSERRHENVPTTHPAHKARTHDRFLRATATFSRLVDEDYGGGRGGGETSLLP